MKKVVVIEDEAVIRDNIIEILELSNYHAIGADNGYVGIQKVIRHEPDLVLCDIMMPEIDGYEVLKTIRKSSPVGNVPFIFLTAKGSPHDFREGMGLGADDYITKPFDKDELLEAIEMRIGRISRIQEDIRSKMNNIKRNISSVYSHEFNTPLNGIIGFTELLIEYYQETMGKEMLDMVQAIQVSGKRLQRVTDNLILFADLQRYDAKLEKPEPYKRGATERFKARLTDDIRLIASIYKREDDMKINLDDGSLQVAYKDLSKIITEAADNAFKYSDRGTTVSVSGKLDGGYMRFAVEDQGEGMKEAIMEEFESFDNLDRSRRLKYGIGLGFYFIRELTRLNRGKIELQTEQDKGTKLIVMLPYSTERIVGY